MSEPIVSIENLSFRFGKGEWLLENASLTIQSCEFMGIIGPNGCGKTTLLKLILGLHTPEQGKLRVCGLRAKEGRHKIGYVPQHNTTSRNFPISVIDTVLMGLISQSRKLGPYTKEDRQRAMAALATLNSGPLAQRPLASLSGGQLQKVMIARALVSEPSLLLLDEPTANLDPKGEDDTYEILNQLKNKMSIVIVSHDVGFVSKYLDRVACVAGDIKVHQSSQLSPETLEQLYGGHVHAVIHDHDH